MAYCIMRIEKRKRSALYGLQIEANRTSEDFKKGRDFAASDINWDFTDFNIFLVKSASLSLKCGQAVPSSTPSPFFRVYSELSPRIIW